MQKYLLIVGESLPSLWRRWLLPGWDCALLTSRSDVSAEISLHCGGCGSSLVESLPSLWRRWLQPGWDCALLTSRSDISADPFHRW